MRRAGREGCRRALRPRGREGEAVASEAGKVVEDAFRIHGGYGYSKECEIESRHRDAPVLLIGDGTSEIQRMVIGNKLLQRQRR